jgi:hypothetical protein
MNLYAVQRDVEDDESDEVLYDGWRYLELAQQLWSLVDERRARDLDKLMARLGGRDVVEVRFTRADLDEAVQLMTGLEAALVGTIVDERQFLPAEGLDDLARRAPGLDLRADRPLGDRRQAVAEALTKVDVVRNFLDRTRSRDRDVVGN